MKTDSPFKILALALFLVGIGFLVGFGFQSRASQQANNGNGNGGAKATPTPAPAPVVRTMQAAPDATKLAITATFANSANAGIWILNLQTRQTTYSASPAGWQDYVVSWKDNATLLLERERIPRPAAEATGGMYEAPVSEGETREDQWSFVTPKLPRGDRLISGFYGTDGDLHLKTRSEPKAIYRVEGDAARKLDDSAFAYGQNRVVNGSLFVVRDLSPRDSRQALFRVQGGAARQISPPLEDVAWSYVAPSGKSFLTAREEVENWVWTLYEIGENGLKKVREAPIPLDVISVFWSPDEKRILGAAGERLWNIEMPLLRATPLGSRTDWSADDVAWIGNSAVAVASQGEIWRVDVPSGKTDSLWKFPREFWK